MKCPKCNREGAYIRLRSKEIVCRSCGAVTKLEDKKKEVKD
jgi:transcription initiation factor TFIIIB Brf1 subunit/transcription initiation factor TFIIB